MSRSTCPDCNRWRCACLAHESDEGGSYGLGAHVPAAGAELPGGLVVLHSQVTPYVAAPCPTYVRERLAALRAEFAERAASAARTYGKRAPC